MYFNLLNSSVSGANAKVKQFVLEVLKKFQSKVETSNFEIEIQGKKRKAKILHKVVYDPENKKLTA